MIEWNHIMDKQPEHGKSIVQVDAAYEGNYFIGVREYYQQCTFEEVLNYYKQNSVGPPNFWWVYSEDFPFPKNNNVKLLYTK